LAQAREKDSQRLARRETTSAPPLERGESGAAASARRVLIDEAEALQRAAARVGEEIDRAAAAVLACSGKVVVTGIGKSGAVARKIAATLASTGTPSFFLHPAEGVHGDLGMVSRGDVVIALSYSGETDELSAILPALRRTGVTIIAFTARAESTLGEAADVVIDVACEREACPLNLAPTTSTTLMMAMGDALALAVMERRQFTAEDYARFHPSGALGRRLLLHVRDVMRTGDRLAVVSEDTPVEQVLFAITKAQAGCACVVDGDGRLTGVMTDGDVRRQLLRDRGVLDVAVGSVMVRSPKTARPDQLAADGLRLMEDHSVDGRPVKIGEMPVLDEAGRPVGILNLKDLIRTGIV
jgi:arabinose-5-phosphate isomerase